MTGRLALVIGIAAMATLSAQVRERDASWKAPVSASARRNPFAGRTDVLAGGAKIYRGRCASCHTEDGGGSLRAPSLKDPYVQAQSDSELFWKVTTGNAHAGMPPFSFLPEAQRWQLVLHLRTLAAKPPL